MRKLILLVVLLTGCETQPTTKSEVRIWKGREGQDAKLWHVTLDVAVEAPDRAAAVSRAASILEMMAKASEMPPVPAEKMEDVPKSGEGKTGV